MTLGKCKIDLLAGISHFSKFYGGREPETCIFHKLFDGPGGKVFWESGTGNLHFFHRCFEGPGGGRREAPPRKYAIPPYQKTGRAEKKIV